MGPRPFANKAAGSHPPFMTGSQMLSGVRIGHPPRGEDGNFPFAIPALQGLREVAFPGPVTILAGENGSGKSTLLEALAIMAKLPTAGSADAAVDESLQGPRKLARVMTPIWRGRSHRGFFLRAEDFFGFVRRLGAMKSEMEERLAEVDRDYADRSDLARKLARGPAAGSLAAMRSRYGDDLDANSHGESFLRLFRSRFVPGGLYLLDEPEAALSPQSQLGFVSMMSGMVGEGGQFVIATHSPVLMAVPDATLYTFDASPMQRVEYEALEGVTLLRSFLQAPARYMRHIWRPPA
ncbi:MAG: AAA family ATPase [Gemmatimonadetes bacterium]|nr:AAA family ATPase [Gemmatimonadota bacterium]MCY3679520.1 AAA family ATPase [Gemmatimonadota bacterium]MYA43547.1 AAA family ATPase [Gemmatimonadota bacterium]MYE93212.1 AAA family ATPase [Gemmatimonadota bacterium]MYJ08840.1 AAA family ATPase [Gemmatimonadota bacterium]